MLARFALAALVSLPSCVIPPSRAALESADIGPMPDEHLARLAGEWAARHWLDDQEAVVQFDGPIQRDHFHGIMGVWAPHTIAWALPAKVPGQGTMLFYFRNDCLIGLGSTVLTGWSRWLRRAYPLSEFADGVPPEWYVRPADPDL